MKLFSPRLWSIAWRVRLGLLIVPCLLALVAWYQFRVANETIERYRVSAMGTDQLTSALTKMQQSAQAMQTSNKSLYEWVRANNSADNIANDSAKDDAEKTYIAPYNEAKARFDEGYKTALAQVPAQSELEKRVNKFYDDGGTWQREIAEPLIGALRDPKPLDGQVSWQPFDKAESDFNEVRDALTNYRSAALSGADRFRQFSTWSLLVLEGASILLAIVMGLGLSRAVTKPLHNIVAQSRSIESGDYHQNFIGGSGEFGEVTRAMNSMAAAISARLEYEKLAGRLAAAVTRSLDPARVLQTTARELGEAMRASRCVLCLTGEAPLWFQWQAPGITPLENSPCENSNLLQNDQTLALSDIQNAPENEVLKAQGVRALLSTPLLLRGQIAGVIVLHQCGEAGQARQWKKAEIALLEQAAAQVAVALDNARLFHQSQQRAAELQAARDALALSSARLQEKNKELEEFVYTVSHDLKAPLISIQGYLDALHKDFGPQLPQECGFYLERIGKNAVQLESLIGELIELSRIGRVRETWDEADTYQLAREAAAELTLQAQAKAVQIEIAPDLPTIYCEKKRVRQVFLNLLDNAIKYSDPAKPVRKISVQCAQENEAWRFEIADNGLGIAPENLEKAFGIFQRLGQNSAKGGANDAAGSGIGLATVRRTAQSHNGQAWAQSAGLGQGTTFYFTISKNPENTKDAL